MIESAMTAGRRSPAWLTLALCSASALLEGFDNQSMGVAAPRVVAEFGLSPELAGLIFSAATVGLFVGAQLILFALAPLYHSFSKRGTGVGAAVAMGRLGSIVGPLFAGGLLARGSASADE